VSIAQVTVLIVGILGTKRFVQNFSNIIFLGASQTAKKIVRYL
jgi:hypothetical protein